MENAARDIQRHLWWG